jgi:protein-S-isoprenylcysteine O-methyltransferase Ste14
VLTVAARSRLRAYALLILAGAIGTVSLLAFALFLYAGPFGLVDLSLAPVAALGLDAALCLAFFLQHSGMIRQSARRRLARHIPSHCFRAVYTIASGVVLGALVVLWQESGQVLFALDGPWRWGVRSIYFLSVAGMAWGVLALGTDMLGLDVIIAHLRGSGQPTMPFHVRGPHRWVRHPLYLFMLLLVWATPDLTVDRLLLNGLWTVWIIIGARLEERDLVAELGDEYRDYQRKVPMLIPVRLRPVRRR